MPRRQAGLCPSWILPTQTPCWEQQSWGEGTNVQSWTACMAPSVDPEPQSIVAADFNGGGISDLAVANLFGPTVTILLGNGDGTFTQKADLSTGMFPPGLAVGNFG